MNASLTNAGERHPKVKVLPFGAETHADDGRVVPKKPMILYVGNITLRKGIHRLLAAWKELEAYRTYELRLIGDMHLTDSFMSGFRGMFTHYKRMSRADLEIHYREASAFVFNAAADGFGNVILEAMSYGTPVLASRNCGAPDVITHGEDGLLIDYGDPIQLKEALEWSLTHESDLATMGRAARVRVAEYSWFNYASAFLQWLQAPADLSVQTGGLEG